MSWENHLTRGSIALARANYALAQDQLNQALAEVKAQRRTSDSRVSTVYSLLAQTFYRQGDYKKAVPLLKQAIALEDKHSNLDVSSKARDLICLAEIARHDGNIEEATGHIDKAIENLQTSHKGMGNEATLALSALFNKAANSQKQSQKQQGICQIIQDEQSYFGTESQSPDNYWQENFDSGVALGASPEESKLESSYVLLLEALHAAASNFSVHDTRFVSTLTALAQTTTRLDLVELTEEILRFCQKLEVTQKVGRDGLIEIKLAFANFYSYLCDFKTSAIYFRQAAELIEQSDTNGYKSAFSFTASFIGMMQKSDLHQSAKLLTTQGLEAEDAQEWKNASSSFEKALLILEQILPKDHLELAELLHFATASLLSEGRVDEAVAARTRAEKIEESALNASQIIESRLRRLPKIKASVFSEIRP